MTHPTAFRCHFVLRALVWTYLLFVMRTQAADANPSAMVHVRFWKTDLPGFSNLRVSFKPSGGRISATREVGAGGPGYVFGNYQDVPAIRGTLELFSGTDKRALASVPTDFGTGTYFTVLLSEPELKGSVPHLEAFNDVPTGQGGTQVTVRSFVIGLKRLKVTVGDSLTAQFDAGHNYLQMRGLKPASCLIQTSGIDSEGKTFEWNTEADFRHSSRQTLLVYPDPYGRIRPRLCTDGEVAPPEEVDSTNPR